MVERTIYHEQEKITTGRHAFALYGATCAKSTSESTRNQRGEEQVSYERFHNTYQTQLLYEVANPSKAPKSDSSSSSLIHCV